MKPSNRRHALCASICGLHSSSPRSTMHASRSFLVSARQGVGGGWNGGRGVEAERRESGRVRACAPLVVPLSASCQSSMRMTARRSAQCVQHATARVRSRVCACVRQSNRPSSSASVRRARQMGGREAVRTHLGTRSRSSCRSCPGRGRRRWMGPTRGAPAWCPPLRVCVTAANPQVNILSGRQLVIFASDVRVRAAACD